MRVDAWGVRQPPPNLVGCMLRQLRHAQGKTLVVVAGLAGVGPSYLRRLETGAVMLDRLPVIVDLAEALEIAPSELMDLQIEVLTAATVTA